MATTPTPKAKGGRTSFADLVGTTGVNSPVDGARATAKPSPSQASLEVPLADLVANPHNPRQHNMNVDDLASIKEMQLQPALGVTEAAYLRLWPEHAERIAGAKIVVVMGNRRLLACHTYGRATLEIVVKDEVAATRATFRAAALRENVERENLDVIEEARAVDELVKDAGSAVKAAEALMKTPPWVSQRRSLLKLTPEIQEKLRAGEIAIRDARKLAQVPMDKQVARWQVQLARQQNERKDEDKPTGKESGTVDVTQIVKTLKKWDARTEMLAPALLAYLHQAGVTRLIAQLEELTAEVE